MSAKSKVIDEKTFVSYTDETGSLITHKTVQDLAESIKHRHTLINHETDLMETEKKTLGKLSTEIFMNDLSKEEPEILGNHEYHLGPEQGTVSVNFKLKARPLTEINGKPAEDIVRGLLQEHADKLFMFNKSHEIIIDESTLRAQACDHPECFDITLKRDLTVAEKMKLVASYPDFLSIAVIDVNKYAEIYPSSVKTTKSVQVNNGFLEDIGKIEPVVLKKARKFIATLIKPMLVTAIVCGNKSKKK